MQFLSRSRIFGAHVQNEASAHGEERHLILRIATIGAVRVGLDELPDRKASRCFSRRDATSLQDLTSFVLHLKAHGLPVKSGCSLNAMMQFLQRPSEEQATLAPLQCIQIRFGIHLPGQRPVK